MFVQIWCVYDGPVKYEMSGHYGNMPMQYTGFSESVKIENVLFKNFDIFLGFAQNIRFEYPQSMF